MRDEWERGGRRVPERADRGIPDGVLVGFLGFLLGSTVLVWSATGLAGWFAHGSWPENVTFRHTPLSVRHLAGQPHDLAGAWPETPPGQLSGYGLFWGLFIGQLMVLVVLTIFVMGTVARWRAVRRARGAGGAGSEASAPPVAGRTGGPVGRPGGAGFETSTPPVTERVGGWEPRAGGAERVEPVPTGSHDDTRAGGVERREPVPTEKPDDTRAGGAENTSPVPPAPTVPTVPTPRTPLVLGSPATRRPLALQAIQDAEGAALIITSDPTLWAETKDARAKLGPVLLYDPSHLCDTPARMHWSPTAGCEDKTTAAHRAAALLAPIRPSAKLDTAVADTAETLMRSFLHAAAVGDKPMKHVHRWSQGTQVQEAVRILRTHPKASSGAAGELEAVLTAYAERRDMAQELTARALSALFTVHVRESCTPNRTDALTLDSFVDEGGTLFVVGEAIEDPKSRQGPGAMPLLTALASSVVEHGRRMAERSSSGRLDPPVTLVLDDVAAVAPLPQLPELLTTGADRGLPTLALLRSREQGRTRWPDSELPA
ncbi:type VI secretion protein [Streptomyces kanamyceticus]|uniref:Type VI secretion protein n=2 Tax=Streptomyces kanamyceticus TaxID=1967 RepID=A0A5J6GEQ0_STRKN|nr:type IV secretory system conjugative DNA transfer family protein [Streptomyces kanamyceticus]QEU93407.1 type VI secretion protein [Streptomyces kanamyceticus]